MENKGQNKEVWTSAWENVTPVSEIQMWDFYGLRPWILKYTPREGKVLEAGCGLGRFVFYLKELGVDTEGVDFSKDTIDFLNNWKTENGFDDIPFKTADVLDLPYDDNSLAGYLSFGVVEHFIEGPHKALKEAFRILRPGGVAIITTPSRSFNVKLRDTKQKLKNIIKKVIAYPIKQPPFFQYWFGAKRLKNYVEQAGFYVSRHGNGDLLYALLEYHKFNKEKVKPGTFANWFANQFENTKLNKLGAQSITISIKLADKMHCFFCGDKTAEKDSLSKYDVPVCTSCQKEEISSFLLKGKPIKYQGKYEFDPPVLEQDKRVCDFCEQTYHTSDIFENYGFSKDVCPECLKKKEVNIPLSNKHVKPVWRSRKLKSV